MEDGGSGAASSACSKSTAERGASAEEAAQRSSVPVGSVAYVLEDI